MLFGFKESDWIALCQAWDSADSHIYMNTKVKSPAKKLAVCSPMFRVVPWHTEVQSNTLPARHQQLQNRQVWWV